MAKIVKEKPSKKSPKAKMSEFTRLKDEFKAKVAELDKQFAKQLKEVKKAAVVKAILVTNTLFDKHTKTKDKAVKNAISQVDKAREAKIKVSKSEKVKPASKKALKPVKVVKSKK